MGNQACQPIKGHNPYDSVRSRSFIGTDNHKNKHISQDEGQSEFPELPTLGDEHSSVKMSKLKEIPNTRIKASAAKKNKSNMNKSYSIQDFDHSNPSSFTKRTSRTQQTNDQSHISARNVSSTYRSDQAVYQKKRNQSFCNFSESNNQTSRRLKHDIFPENHPDEEMSKQSYSKSTTYRENVETPKGHFVYFNEKMNQKFAETPKTYGHKKNFSCTLENNQNLLGEYEYSSPDASDPIQLYLKRFAAANNGDHRPSEEYIPVNRDSVPRTHIQAYRLSPERKRHPQANDYRLVGQNPFKSYEEECNKGYNLTFEDPGSSNETTPSESILSSEPEVYIASQISIEPKRPCNYDVPNGAMLVNHQKFRNQAYGSKNLSSITEFDQENYAKLHLVDSRPSLNGGILSRQNIDHPSTKANSTQDSFNIYRKRPPTTSERSFSSLSSLEKMQGYESARTSDFSTTPSLLSIQAKENEQYNHKRIPIENFYPNTNNQMTQHQLQIVTSFNTPNLLKNDYLGEMPGKESATSQKVSLFERIPTVPECVQETEQSVETFTDTLNRTSELSMMSPTNIERNNNIMNFSPFQIQNRDCSPERDSLRQFVLSTNLKKTPVPAEDMLMYPNQFVLNTRNLNCPDDSYGINSSHFNSGYNTKVYQNLEPERQDKQYVRRYNSALDYTKKENKSGS